MTDTNSDESVYKECQNISGDNLAQESFSSQQKPDYHLDYEHAMTNEEAAITSEVEGHEELSSKMEEMALPVIEDKKVEIKDSINVVSKKKLISGLLIAFIVIALAVKGPDIVNSYSIYQMGRHNDVAGLSSYIQANSGQENKGKYVDHAIRVLVGINSDDSQSALEDMLNKDENVLTTRILISRRLADTGVSVKSGGLLYSSYCQATDLELQNEMKRLLLLASQSQIYQEIKSDLETMAMPGAVLAVKFKDVQDFAPGHEQDARQLIAAKLNKNLAQAIADKDIDSIQALIKCWQVYGTDQGQSIGDIQQAIDKYYALVLSLLQAQRELDNNNKLLSEARNQISQLDAAESQYLTLQGFIVGDHGDDIYEFAFPEYGYFGRLPSSDHGLLMTVDTSYQSKGWFSLRVMPLSTIPVKLKEDFGSFTQDWPIYMEVSNYTIQQTAQQRKKYQTQRDQATAAINRSKSQIQTNQQEIDKEMALILNMAQKIK